MALHLISAKDELLTEQILICVYALPDLGKSTLGLTANRPLLIDFDGLVHKAPNRSRGDVIRLDNWTDLNEISAGDLSAYDTIVIDTAGRAIDLLKEHASNLEMANRQADGNLSIKGWGVVKRLFKEWLQALRASGKDIVLLVHLNEEKSGDNIFDRLDVEGGSKAEIYKSSLAICRIILQGKDQRRYLDFSPHPNSIGKNPGQLDLIPFDTPDKCPNTLALVIQMIKDHMNKMAIPFAEPEDPMADWEKRIKAIGNLVSLNKLVPEVKNLDVTIKMLVHKRAKELGFTYNQKEGMYESKRKSTGGADQRTNKGVDEQKSTGLDAGNDARGLSVVASTGARGRLAVEASNKS